MRSVLLLFLCLLAGGPRAEEVVAKLSQTEVAISTSFSGSEIFVYGAIRQDYLSDEPLDVIVTIKGPSEPVIVRRKQRQLGVWVNGPGIEVDAAPSLYAIATTGPLYEVISHVEDLIHNVALDQAVLLIGDPQYDRYPEDHRRALIRLRHEQGLYFRSIGGVEVTQGTLFETSLALPGRIVEGDYKARVLLLRDREVIDVFEDTIFVRRVGIERWVYNMSQERPALYGLMSIALALVAGWTASTIFRVLLP